LAEGEGGDLDSDEAKTRSKRTKEQVQTKNRNKKNTFQSDTPAGRRICCLFWRDIGGHIAFFVSNFELLFFDDSMDLNINTSGFPSCHDSRTPRANKRYGEHVEKTEKQVITVESPCSGQVLV